MTPDEVEKVTIIDERSKRNEARIKYLEEGQKALNELAASVKYICETNAKIEKKIDHLGEKVNFIEQKPAKRWDSVVEKIIAAVIAGLVGFAMAKVGMG